MVAALYVAVLAPLVIGTALMAGDRLAARALGHTAAWTIAALTACVTLVATILAAVGGAEVDQPWVPRLGMRLHLTIDGISGPLVVLAAAVTLLAVAVSVRQRPTHDAALFYGSILVVLAGALAAFMARDVLVFFVAFEVVLIPMWVLIDRFGDEHADRRRASWMFVLYTAAGSMLMLAGLLVLSVSAGTTNIDRLTSGAAAQLPFGTQMTAALLLTLGLAIKVPLLGVHTWLPRAHTVAPTAGSMLLAAVLLKLGTYGFVRFVIFPLPDAWDTLAPYVAVLAVAGILWGGLMCLQEPDLKTLVAWSSIAHMGFVMAALAAGQQLGIQAALYGNIAHGVISALLFAIVGALKERRGSVDLTLDTVGLRSRDPKLGFALILGFAASLGLPGLAGFWGEVLSIFALFSVPGRWHSLFEILTALAAVGAALAGAYCVRVIRALWAGELPDPESVGAADDRSERVRGAEWGAIAILCLAVVVLGVAPNLIMNMPVHEITAVLAGAK